jgi:LPS sulfotransferase NodH
MRTMSNRSRGAAAVPVAFIVGAGRSGTTLLYKLLCLHPEVAYISNYENRLGWLPDGIAARTVNWRMEDKLRAWFNQGGNAYFTSRPLLKKAFPTPHEGESVFKACGVPLYPARGEVPDDETARRLRGRFERIRRRADARTFLSKRTANNRRIRYLSAIFPDARFVHLMRDGREVARSLAAVSWWDRHRVWWDGRTAIEMENAGEDRLAICARNWVREFEEVRAQLASVDSSQILELRYEELLQDPVHHLEKVLQFLGLEPLACYRATIRSLNLRPTPSSWSSALDGRQVDCVLRETRPLLRELGYAE